VLELDYLLIDTPPRPSTRRPLVSIAMSDLLVPDPAPGQSRLPGATARGPSSWARRLDVPELMVLVNKVPEGVELGHPEASGGVCLSRPGPWACCL